MGETLTMLERAEMACGDALLNVPALDILHGKANEAITRAVIASLREPSEAVAEIGAGHAEYGGASSSRRCWRAMIDAILEEGKTLASTASHQSSSTA